MEIQLSHLTLHNFGIFKDCKIDFKGKDIIGILAEYQDDKTRSNRSGKTLILEAIKYNLIGTTRAKRNINMIHHGQESMMVTCIYSDSDGKEYKVRRGVDLKGNSVLELDWVEKTREAQEAIKDLFGVDREDFELTSYFKQSDINGFMDLSPAEKSKYLMQSMDITHWKEKYDLVAEDVKKYSNKLRDNETIKKALEQSLEDSDDLEAVESDYKSKVKKLSKDKKKLTEKSDILKSQIIIVKQKKTDAISKCRHLQERIDEINNSSGDIERWNEIIKKCHKENQRLINEMHTVPDRDLLVTRFTKLKNQGIQAKDKVASMEANTGICPILNTECKEIKVKQSDINSLKKKMIDIRSEMDECKKLISIDNNNKRLQEVVQENKERRLEFENKVKQVKSEDNTEKLMEELKQYQQFKHADTDGLEDDEAAIEDKIDDIDQELDDVNQKLGGVSQRIAQAKEALDQINKVSEANVKLKTILGDLRYISTMFSKNGIAANEIENAFQVIEDECNMLLKELEYGPVISFNPDKELTKWEAICHCGFKFPKGYRQSECVQCSAQRTKQRKEEISLTILEDGQEKDFSMDSGGGKLIISFVVRLALTMYKRRQNKCKLNILFLDEIDSALDAHLASSVTNAITKVLTKRLGFNQIFMISHKDEIKNSVPYILKVTRFKTYSTAGFI